MVDSEFLGRAEGRRVDALATLDAERRARFGQFYTPERAAVLIARMPRLPASGRIRVLDPGAGTGSLAAALVARVLGEVKDLEIDVVAVEVDPQVVPFLEATLADCVDTAAAQDAKVSTRVVVGDYIDLTTGLLASETALVEPFDLVIMNPPYRKLAASSGHRLALASRGADCPNLYAAFLALGVEALRSGGQLVAITPRSFANGPYFGRFRHFLLDRIAIDHLHVFESRSTVFSDTGVLQENVVFSGTRDGIRQRVLLSSSKGHTDETVERVVAYEEVIRPADPEQFVRIASCDQDTAMAEVMAGLPCALSDLAVEVSTGKVVDFRARENLRETVDRDCVPLVYPGNVTGGIVEWPRAIRKAQGFAVTNHLARKLLVPAGRYVVVKRFSAKEERRRVVAAVWDTEVNGESPVAFENHLNVFHSHGAGLDRDLAVGLSLWLNCTLVDRFFRTFSGHTQVNAADLRSLRFPSAEALRELGNEQPAALPEQRKIDALVRKAITEVGAAA